MPNPIRAVNNFMTRPVYEPPIARGSAGGGIRGALSRFARGVGRETVANTPGELLGGGPVNPGRGIIGGLREAWGGSLAAYNRRDERGEYGPPSSSGGPSGSPIFSNRQRTGPITQPGSALPSWLMPGQPVQDAPNDWEDNGSPSYPVFSWEQQHPSNQQRQQAPAGAPIRPSSSGAGRMGGTTIATGGAAENMARGFAGSPMGASSYGRDRMMTTYREA